MKATLALENGTVLTGISFGAPGKTFGEAVFNTSLSGYQEIFTDPSYAGQIVVMTSPMIGNYGVNDADLESVHPRVAGVVVREYVEHYSNFRAQESLGAWLRRFGIVALQGVDTRMLTRTIRSQGAMRAAIATGDADSTGLVNEVLASPSMAGRDLATEVSCALSYGWAETDTTPFALAPMVTGEAPSCHVVACDYGIKHNILRRLASYGCRVTVVPAGSPAEHILALNPDGVFLSNGPGDPAATQQAVEAIRGLVGRVPLFGICLGHQLLALALGGSTYKLKFGHRGGNHPVKNLLTGAVEITSQNHGFAVHPESLDPSAIEITHINLNDGTNEGFRHRRLPIFSVQYHPEASPGPHDSDYLFRDFVALMKANTLHS
jgi:carbamoyl-phosphate synthase small subunit